MMLAPGYPRGYSYLPRGTARGINTYCYNYVTHETSFDTTEEECVGTAMWVIPGDDGDPYFNSYCDSCPDGFYADDCGH